MTKFKEFVSISYGNFDGKNNICKIFFVAQLKEKQIFLYGYKIQNSDNTKIIINKNIGEITDYHNITDDPCKDLVFTTNGNHKVLLSNNSIVGAPKLIECEVEININKKPYVEDIQSNINKIRDVSYEMYKRISMGILSKKKLNEKINKQFAIPENEVVSTYLLEMLMTNQNFTNILSFNDETLKDMIDNVFLKKGALDVTLNNIATVLQVNKEIVKNNASKNITTMSDYMFLVRKITNYPLSFFNYSLETLNKEKYKEIVFSKEEKNYKQIITDTLFQFTRLNYIELFVDGTKVLETQIVPIYQDQMFSSLSDKVSIVFQGAKIGVPLDNTLVVVDEKIQVGISVPIDNIPNIFYKTNDKYDKMAIKTKNMFEFVVGDNRVFLVKLYNKSL